MACVTVSFVKQCPLCGEEKSLEDFYRYRNGKVYRLCKKCHRKRTKDWHKANPQCRQGNNLMRRFGLVEAQYEQLHRAQDGLCAICERPESVSGRRLAVDHSHETGEIRGLLCHSCNTGIGKLQDNPVLLKRAANYLERELTWPVQPSLQPMQP